MGKSPTLDMLDAFRDFYGRDYSEPQRQVMGKNLGALEHRYTLDLFKVVINRFEPTQNRPLPDMPALRKAQEELPHPATYRPALPDPDDVESTYSPDLDNRIQAELDRRMKDHKEENHEERARLRAKVKKGDGTKWEVRWMAVIDDYDGDWRAAYKALGEVE